MRKQAVVQLIPDLPKVIPPEVREKVSTALHALLDAAEALITFVDDIAGDPNLEDSGEDEPSLGSRDGEMNQARWSAGRDDDREEEHDGREPDVDDEPYLSTGAEHWAIGGPYDDTEADLVPVEALP